MSAEKRFPLEKNVLCDTCRDFEQVYEQLFGDTNSIIEGHVWVQGPSSRLPVAACDLFQTINAMDFSDAMMLGEDAGEAH